MLPTTLITFAAANCKAGFFGIPHWYEYLTLDNQCQVTNFTVPGDLTLVALALIDILLHIAGLAAVVYVIYGGIQYATSQGNPDQASKARSAVIGALVGLAISVTAIAFVSFLGSQIGK